MRETVPQVAPRPGDGRIAVPADPADAEGKRDSSARLQVNGFRFEGNTRIADEELRQGVLAISQAAGKLQGLADLDAVAAEVTRYYRRRGYLVAVAYVRPQEVQGGIVTISILAGRLDGVRTQARAGYSAETLQAFLEEAVCDRAAPHCRGTVLEAGPVERAVGLVADLPGVADASGTLAPGAAVGSSDLQLNVDPGPAVEWRIGVDNHGNLYIGRERVTGGVRLDNVAGWGESIALSLYSTGRGMKGGMLNGSVPVGYDGWRVGIELTRFQYRLGAPFDVLDSHGEADALTAYASYPLVRSNLDNLYFRGGYGVKSLSDSVLESELDKRERSVLLGLSGSSIDRFFGGGLSAGGLTFLRGRMDYLFALPPGAKDGSGRFDKVNYNISRDQTLWYPDARSRVSLYALLRGQRTDRNLDSAESFSLGGPDGVRAYPQGEALGDMGDIATLELRYSIAAPFAGGSDLGIALLRDYGRITVNHDPVPGFTDANKRTIGGSGIALTLTRRKAFVLGLTWAARDSGEPATSEPDERSRVWGHAIFYF